MINFNIYYNVLLLNSLTYNNYNFYIALDYNGFVLMSKRPLDLEEDKNKYPVAKRPKIEEEVNKEDEYFDIEFKEEITIHESMPNLLKDLHSKNITELEKSQIINTIIDKVILYCDYSGDQNELELNILIEDINIYKGIQKNLMKKGIVLTE